MNIKLHVNGAVHEVDAAPSTPLLYVLRNDLGLHGPHFGCGLGQCGACTVIVDGAPVRSCLMLAVQVDGCTVETVEGLAKKDDLSPLQQAFSTHHGLQCGFCTPGMLMTLEAFLRASPSPTEQDIRIAISGNICRCTGYQGIVEAALAVAAAKASSP